MTKTRKTKPADRTDINTGTGDVNPTGVASVDSESKAGAAPAPPTEPAPTAKPPSKQQQLAALVVRDEGATLD